MKYLIILACLLLPMVKAYGATDPYTAKIKHLRVESSYGFITMEGTLPWAERLTCSNERVWLDLRDEIDKIKYSTALAALMAGKNIYIRAINSSNDLVFGACKLYDIIIFP